MRSRREVFMLRSSLLTGALAALLMVGGCDLDVENPNAPDARRALVDKAGLQQLLGGAFRTWVQTRGSYFAGIPLTAMADNYTASWNNAAIRYYSSVASDCPQRCGWNNSATAPEAAGGPTVEASWYGYYTVLSSANDVLLAIDNGICFDNDCDVDNTLTSRNRAVAKMLQGMALAGIALLYDKGFVVDETTDITNPFALEFSDRADMRDAALLKLEDAWTEAGLKNWSTPSEWMGVGAGRVYTSDQIRRLIRTMQAELVALWPRTAAENDQAQWGQVATYASQGISSGAPFDWEFFVDVSGSECAGDELDCVKTWGNSIGTMRVDTRVASMLASNHVHPWPEPDGNPCPTISADRRVGDGSWGPANDFNGYATRAATANAGSDFACSGVAIFPPARGQYHQSNLVHVRYQHLAYIGENLPGADGTGQDPFYTRQMNDLLWAEGLIRSGGSKVTAAGLINNSRVGRGGAGCAVPGAGGCGLVPLTGVESDADMLAALQYEQEIEFMGQGPTVFFNRRRIDGLIAGTPRHMPVPAKELDVLLREIYTFGGPSAPALRVVGGTEQVSDGANRVRSVGEIWKEYQARSKFAAARKH